MDEARDAARRIGYPLIVRPSYVLGGRSMAIIYDDCDLVTYMDPLPASPDRPVYLDAFLSRRY